MDTKALQFASRFSLPPNSLGYCGKDSAPEKFKSCVIDRKCVGVSKELKEFIVLHPYLKTLSEIIGQDTFSYKVVEAYWLGNNELKKVKAKDYEILLKNFKKQGVPSWLIEELSQKPPKVFIPTHLFQILHVGVGRASGSVPYNLKSINNCMIRWGKVKKIVDGKVIVRLNSLKKVKGKYKLVVKEEKLLVVPGFTPKLKVDDVVCAHWGQITKILDKREIKKLVYWTREVLKNFSKQEKLSSYST